LPCKNVRHKQKYTGTVKGFGEFREFRSSAQFRIVEKKVGRRCKGVKA